MKKIIILLFLFLTMAYAESITIINDIKNSKVYLNGIMIGTGSVNQFEVQSGEYNIQIKVGDETVFREMVVIYPGEQRVINANTFVPVKKSKVANVGSKRVEEQRLKKATKGNIALGAKFGGIISGASVKWFPVNKFGTQFTLWGTSSETSNQLSYQARVLFEIDDQLANTDELYTAYVGVGIGRSSDELNESKIESVLLTDTTSELITAYEAFIGIEFPGFNQISYWFVEWGYLLAVKEYKKFNGSSTNDSNGSFVLMAGIHIYFH